MLHRAPDVSVTIKAVFTSVFLLILAGAVRCHLWCSNQCVNLRPTPRLAVHPFVFFGLRGLGCGVGRSWLPVLHRVTSPPSSPCLCFPCKVWGFSKQTGGDKHMLWTALCWVVSEGQQSRSLSGCGYTSHSGTDGRSGALLLPRWW